MCVYSQVIVIENLIQSLKLKMYWYCCYSTQINTHFQLPINCFLCNNYIQHVIYRPILLHISSKCIVIHMWFFSLVKKQIQRPKVSIKVESFYLHGYFAKVIFVSCLACFEVGIVKSIGKGIINWAVMSGRVPFYFN